MTTYVHERKLPGICSMEIMPALCTSLEMTGVHWSVLTVHSTTLFTVYFALFTVHGTLYTVHFKLFTAYLINVQNFAHP